MPLGRPRSTGPATAASRPSSAGAGREALAPPPRRPGRSAPGGRYGLALPVRPERPAARAGRACGRRGQLEARAEATVAHGGHPDRRPGRLLGPATGLPPPLGSNSLAPPARPRGRLGLPASGPVGSGSLEVPGRPCGRWPGTGAPRRPSREGRLPTERPFRSFWRRHPCPGPKQRQDCLGLRARGLWSFGRWGYAITTYDDAAVFILRSRQQRFSSLTTYT